MLFKAICFIELLGISFNCVNFAFLSVSRERNPNADVQYKALYAKEDCKLISTTVPHSPVWTQKNNLNLVVISFLLRIHYSLSLFPGSGLGDLHFFGVAMLLLSLHKLHMVLTVGNLPLKKTFVTTLLSGIHPLMGFARLHKNVLP